MKFLCLGYYDSQTMDALPQAEIAAIMSQCGPPLEAFYGTGQVNCVERLMLEWTP